MYFNLNKNILSLINKIKIYSNLFTAPKRALPDFLIIGAQKCGTSTLFDYISQHYQVIPPLKKEMHYFDKKYNLSSYWYRAHFPLKKELGKDKITGEKSTDYIYHPEGAERIKETIGKPKLILILRNPAERAISQYQHMVRAGRENRNPQMAFREEKEFLKSISQKDISKASFVNKKKFNKYSTFSYIRKGLYLGQIKSFYEYFTPDQLFIESTENLKIDPNNIIKRIYQFLDIDTQFLPDDLTPKNRGKYKLDENLTEITEELKNYYTPHNEALFDYLGKRFPWE